MASMFDPPRLLYKSSSHRRMYWRRLPMLLLGIGAAAAAYWALTVAQQRQVVTLPLLLDVGRLVAVVLAGLLFVLAGLALYRGLTRRDVRIQVFDRGFTWRTRLGTARTAWKDVTRVREGATGLYLGRWPLLRWGEHRLVTADGAVFRFTTRHGDPRQFMAAARPYLARVHGTLMGRTLREELPVKLHPRLTVYPGGVEARGREIPWSQLDVAVRGGTLHIRRRRENGRFATVARYPITQIDNLGGFMQVATQTIRNAQPERFRSAVDKARIAASG